MRKREILVVGLIAGSTATLIVYFTLSDHVRAQFHQAAADVRIIESAAMLSSPAIRTNVRRCEL